MRPSPLARPRILAFVQQLDARLPRPVVFAAVGVANTAVDVAAYWVLTRLGHLDPLLSNALAYMLGSLQSYVVNGKLTFRSSRRRLLAAAPILAFVMTCTASLAGSTLVMFLLIRVMPDLAAKLVTVGVTFLINYSLSRTIVYRRVQAAVLDRS